MRFSHRSASLDVFDLGSIPFARGITRFWTAFMFCHIFQAWPNSWKAAIPVVVSRILPGPNLEPPNTVFEKKMLALANSTWAYENPWVCVADLSRVHTCKNLALASTGKVIVGQAKLHDLLGSNYLSQIL